MGTVFLILVAVQTGVKIEWFFKVTQEVLNVTTQRKHKGLSGKKFALGPREVITRLLPSPIPCLRPESLMNLETEC